MAGPQLIETVLRDGSLSRLYLTLTHQLLGGEHFHTVTANGWRSANRAISSASDAPPPAARPSNARRYRSVQITSTQSAASIVCAR
jgi:hypothetical protein